MTTKDRETGSANFTKPVSGNQLILEMDSEFQREVCARLAQIEAAMERLAVQQCVKEWYSTTEVARAIGKSPYTVREWCRYGRLRASKRRCGRGTAKEWMVSHDEVERLKNEGLLPLRKYST
jgi:hypothetical protein